MLRRDGLFCEAALLLYSLDELIHEVTHDVVDDFAADLGNHETLAERTIFVTVTHDGIHLSDDINILESEVDHWHLLISLCHVDEGFGHVHVHLDLRVEMDGLAIVLGELILALEENASLDTTQEFHIKSRGDGAHCHDATESFHI